jgi:hypothetical protein
MRTRTSPWARRAPGGAFALAALSLPAASQGSVFQTPGMPVAPAPSAPPQAEGDDTGQVSRFSSVFNPAFSFVVDGVLDHLDDDAADDDGFDAELRTLELSASSWVDPSAWAYFVAAMEDETLHVEEAAVHYTGFGGRHTLRAGRFFLDFGKQMQVHVHELRTLERPLALRTYLGDEAKGDGLQWDSWFAAGDETAVRWSIGLFADTLPEHEDDLDPASEPVAEVASRKDLEDFHATARVTGFTDVGDSGVFQLGASLRAVPSFDFVYEVDGTTIGGDLSNLVWGLDATYGWSDETAQRRWTFGTEVLLSTGDNGASIDDPDGTPGSGDETFEVLDDPVAGFYAFADYAWDRSRSAGIQYGRVELPDGNDTEAEELEIYYTRMLSEFHRLRFVAAVGDSDLADTSTRFALQYTAFVGAHGHGTNW